MGYFYRTVSEKKEWDVTGWTVFLLEETLTRVMGQIPVFWATKLLMQVLICQNVSCKEVHVTNWRMKWQHEMLLQEPTASCDLSALGDTFWKDHMPIHEGSLLLRWSEHHENRSHLTYTQFCINKTLKRTVVQWYWSLLTKINK